MTKNYQIPFDDQGNQQHYPSNIYRDGKIIGPVFKDNEEFEDALIYDGYSRGRSAAYFNFERKSTGTNVTVFLTDFEDMIPIMVNGGITGRFTYTKRGQNYGVKLV